MKYFIPFIMLGFLSFLDQAQAAGELCQSLGELEEKYDCNSLKECKAKIKKCKRKSSLSLSSCAFEKDKKQIKEFEEKYDECTEDLKKPDSDDDKSDLEKLEELQKASKEAQEELDNAHDKFLQDHEEQKKELTDTLHRLSLAHILGENFQKIKAQIDDNESRLEDAQEGCAKTSRDDYLKKVRGKNNLAQSLSFNKRKYLDDRYNVCMKIHLKRYRRVKTRTDQTMQGRLIQLAKQKVDVQKELDSLIDSVESRYKKTIKAALKKANDAEEARLKELYIQQQDKYKKNQSHLSAQENCDAKNRAKQSSLRKGLVEKYAKLNVNYTDELKSCAQEASNLCSLSKSTINTETITDDGAKKTTSNLLYTNDKLNEFLRKLEGVCRSLGDEKSNVPSCGEININSCREAIGLPDAPTKKNGKTGTVQ